MPFKRYLIPVPFVLLLAACGGSASPISKGAESAPKVSEAPATEAPTTTAACYETATWMCVDGEWVVRPTTTTEGCIETYEFTCVDGEQVPWPTTTTRPRPTTTIPALDTHNDGVVSSAETETIKTLLRNDGYTIAPAVLTTKQLQSFADLGCLIANEGGSFADYQQQVVLATTPVFERLSGIEHDMKWLGQIYFGAAIASCETTFTAMAAAG